MIKIFRTSDARQGKNFSPNFGPTFAPSQLSRKEYTDRILQLENEPTKQRTGHRPSYAEVKKMKYLAVDTHGSLKESFSSSTCSCFRSCSSSPSSSFLYFTSNPSSCSSSCYSVYRFCLPFCVLLLTRCDFCVLPVVPGHAHSRVILDNLTPVLIPVHLTVILLVLFLVLLLVLIVRCLIFFFFFFLMIFFHASFMSFSSCFSSSVIFFVFLFFPVRPLNAPLLSWLHWVQRLVFASHLEHIRRHTRSRKSRTSENIDGCRRHSH